MLLHYIATSSRLPSSTFNEKEAIVAEYTLSQTPFYAGYTDSWLRWWNQEKELFDCYDDVYDRFSIFFFFWRTALYGQSLSIRRQ